MNPSPSSDEARSAASPPVLFSLSLWVGIGSLLALGIWAHGGSLEAEYVNYDDPNIVVENELVRDPSLAKAKLLFSELRDQAYLPIYYLSFWIDDVFGADSARGHHGFNLAWHLLNVVLLFALFRRLSPTRTAWFAFLAAALFCVHPVIVESVAWVSSRKDLVSFAALLASLHFFLSAMRRSDRSLVFGLAALAVFSLGMFAKATILVAPFLAWFLSLSERRRLKRSETPGRVWVGAWFFLSAGLTALHFAVAKSQGTADVQGSGGLERAVDMLGVLGRYLENLVVPAGLSVHYDVIFGAGFGMDQVLGLLGLGLAGFALVQVLRRGSREPRPESFLMVAAVGWLWLLASLIPFNNLVPRFSIAMADRYLYVGAAGFSLALFALLFFFGAAFAKGWPLRIAGLLIVAAAAFGARDRVEVWQNSESLWRDALAKTERSAIPSLQLGAALEDRAARERDPALIAEAVEHYENGVRRSVGDRELMQARLKLSPTLVRVGRSEEALRQFELIEQLAADRPELELKPEDLARLQVSRASALLSLGRLDEARSELQQVDDSTGAALDARNLEAFADIVEANGVLNSDSVTDAERVAAQKVFDRGLENYAKILEVDAKHEKTRVEQVQALSAATWRSDSVLEASRLARELVDDFPKNAQARYLKARLYADVDAREAERDLKIATQLDPHRTEVYLLLERIQREQGRNKDAIAALSLGLKHNPDELRLEQAMSQSFLAFAYHHKNTKAPDLALEAVVRSLRFADDNIEAHVLRGELLVERTAMKGRSAREKADDWEDARRGFERVLKQIPDHARARAGLATYHRARGLARLYPPKKKKVEGAVVEAESEEKRLARESLAYDDLQRAATLGKGNPEFASLPRLVARHGELCRQRALEASAEGRFEEAIALAQRALTMRDYLADDYALVARIADQAGRDVYAATHYKLALKTDPEHLRSLYEFGRIRYAEQDWLRAEELLARFYSVAHREKFAEALAPQLKVASEMLEVARKNKDSAQSSERGGGDSK